MGKAAKKVNFATVRRMVDGLDEEHKLALLTDLEDELLDRRFDTVLADIRKRAAEDPISDEEIRRECETVRQALYDEEKVASRR